MDRDVYAKLIAKLKTMVGLKNDVATAKYDIDVLKGASEFNDYLAVVGKNTISASYLESGQWSFTRKDSSPSRARTKFLIPVRAGMVITYSNTTFDTYFNVAATPTSNNYITNIGWKTDGNGTIPITVDGYLTFIIRIHSNTTAPVNPSDFNSTVIISTEPQN